MRFPFTFLLSMLCGFCICVVAQAQNALNLVFNSYDNVVQMNFSTGAPVLSYTGLDNGFEGIAHVEDPAGNIMFMVNANGVFDANHTLMPGSVGLIADPSSAEISISPIPGQPGKYYVFYNAQVCSNLYYSVVDMNLNSGLGDVTNLNTLLASGSYAEGLEVIPVNNGSPVEFRLIAFDCNAGFVTFNISGGVLGIPQTLYGFTTTTANDNYDGRSELDFNSGRLGIAFANSAPSEALIGSYDPNTNTFSNPIDFVWNDAFANGFYGIEFSPDGSKAYLTSWYVTNDTNLVVYDFNTGMANFHVTPYAPGQIELASNGKMYFINDYSSYITEIDNPDSVNLVFNQILTTSSLALGISDQYVFTVTGMDRLNGAGNVRVYPNPASTQLHVAAELTEPCTFVVYDVASRKLLEEPFRQSLTLDVSKYTAGVYLYELKKANGASTKGKLLIEP